MPVRTSTPRSASSACTRAPSCGSTVGSTSGSCSIWVTARPRVVSASAISRPMYPAPTMTALAGDVSVRVPMRAKVSPIECSRCTPSAGPERGEPGDGRADGDRAGADDQLVVGDQVLGPVRAGDEQLVAGGVDAAGGGVQPQPHPGRLQVGDGAVGEVAPVGDLAGDVVGDAADGEVRVGVGHHHGDLRARVDLACAERGADAGVAPADGDHVHDYLPFPVRVVVAR